MWHFRSLVTLFLLCLAVRRHFKFLFETCCLSRLFLKLNFFHFWGTLLWHVLAAPIAKAIILILHLLFISTRRDNNLSRKKFAALPLLGMGLTDCDWLFWSAFVMVWLVLVWYVVLIVLTTYLVAYLTLNKINNFCFLGFERTILVYLELCQLPTWTRKAFNRLLFLLRMCV